MSNLIFMFVLKEFVVLIFTLSPLISPTEKDVLGVVIVANFTSSFCEPSGCTERLYVVICILPGGICERIVDSVLLICPVLGGIAVLYIFSLPDWQLFRGFFFEGLIFILQFFDNVFKNIMNILFEVWMMN